MEQLIKNIDLNTANSMWQMEINNTHETKALDQ